MQVRAAAAAAEPAPATEHGTECKAAGVRDSETVDNESEGERMNKSE